MKICLGPTTVMKITINEISDYRTLLFVNSHFPETNLQFTIQQLLSVIPKFFD